MGFRGSKKNTPYAAQMAAEDCSKVAIEAGLKSNCMLRVQETDVSLHPIFTNGGIEVTEIIDVHQCLTMDVVLQKDVEFNNIFKYN
jgi:small subunit ribosomal protein S11